MNPCSEDDSSPVRVEHAVAHVLATAATREDGYSAVLEAIGRSFGWCVGAIWESASPDGDDLRCVTVWHETDVVLDADATRVLGHADAGLDAACSFPICAPIGRIGVAEFFAREAREVDEDLAATVRSIGNQLGQFVAGKRAEDAVASASELTRAMLDAALDCIVMIDDEGRVLEFNPAAERTFGYRSDEAVGERMSDLIVPPSARSRHLAGIRRYLDGGPPVILDRRIEVTGMRRDRTEFPIELTITRIDLPGPARFVGYLRDITEIKNTEREVRASRARVAEAAYEERRRLERDLHDGAQQRLVSLGLALRIGRASIAEDPAAAGSLIDEAISDLQAATVELRELARGIHPAVLTAGGLGPAVRTLITRMSGGARLVDVPAGRFPAPVEAAVYFVVAEALTNASRYSGATNVEVRISHRDGQVELEVRDDGCGGADPAGGTGLRGVADRVSALGGAVEVTSPSGEGTTVRARIPHGTEAVTTV